MIIWRGWGILVLFIVVLFEILGYLLITDPLGFASQSKEQDITGYLLFIPAAVVIWFLGTYLNGKRQRIFIDQETGQKVTFPAAHSFFFVRMEYWAFILPVIAIILTIVRLVG